MKMPLRLLVASFLLVLLGCESGAEVYELSVGDTVLRVEIADTTESRANGLMHREELAGDHGMLFVFPESDYRAFWMRNTLIPLSIAYIDERLTILEIHDMQPLDESPVPSRYPAQYALEVNQGAFERLGIAPGDRIILSAPLRDRVRSVVGP
jgi:uncharacterized membrane protein (UPF0127 family)